MMDIAVFDTNILIDFSHQNPDAQEIIRRVPHRLISITSWVEFLTGIPAPQMAAARGFLDDMFDIIEADRSVFELALDIRKNHRLKLPDALIYATAQVENAPLITRNTKDFKDAWDDIYIPYAA